MNLDFTPEQEAFAAEARAWIAEHVPAERFASMDTAEGFEQHRAWERQLADGRWSVVSSPAEYGGREVGITEWVIFEEEYYRSGAPTRVAQNGISLLAPIIFEHGTPEQQAKYLLAMANGSEIWAQAWSEPGGRIRPRRDPRDGHPRRSAGRLAAERAEDLVIARRLGRPRLWPVPLRR